MGDVGSLALGGTLGMIAIIIKKELWLVVLGGVFVVEAGSVILQVMSFKMTGKRIFKMSPFIIIYSYPVGMKIKLSFVLDRGDHLGHADLNDT